MIDCSKTENYLREKLRMCKSLEYCDVCRLNKGKFDCDCFASENPQDAIAIVQAWSDGHPRKTMLDDFREKYPNAPLTEDTIPHTCPCWLGYEKGAKCVHDDMDNVDCAACWNRPYMGSDKDG